MSTPLISTEALAAQMTKPDLRIIDASWWLDGRDARADFELLAPGGLAVVYGSGQPEASVPFVPGILKNLQLAFFIVYHLPPAARERAQSQLTAWLAEGKLQHRIAARLPLARIAEAHALVESGRAIGNVVVQAGEDA